MKKELIKRGGEIATNILKKKYLKLHNVNKIGKNAYMISVGLVSNAYLFVGKEKAMLIDTGIGIRGLRETVEGITNKPLIVAATHAHPDIVGGAGEFEKVLIHKQDLKYAKHMNNPKLRKAIFKVYPARYFFKLQDEDLIENTGSFEILKDNETFDLGGRKIKVIHTPCHTKGSCCFKDSETGIVVSGDMATPIAFMIFPHATTMAVYAKSMEKLIEALGDGENYCARLPKPLKESRTGDLKDLADEAVAYGNDYDAFLKVRSSEDHRRFVIYFPAKTLRRKFRDRMRCIY